MQLKVHIEQDVIDNVDSFNQKNRMAAPRSEGFALVDGRANGYQVGLNIELAKTIPRKAAWEDRKRILSMFTPALAPSAL